MLNPQQGQSDAGAAVAATAAATAAGGSDGGCQANLYQPVHVVCDPVPVHSTLQHKKHQAPVRSFGAKKK